MSEKCLGCGGEKGQILISGGGQIYECLSCTTPGVQRAILRAALRAEEREKRDACE